MDCRTARQLLEFARPRSLELEGGEAEALESHLADCPECGPLAQVERQLDDRIGRALRAVPVPDGLHDRLLSRLTYERRVVQRKWFASVAVAATILLAAGAGVYWHYSRPTRVEIGSLVGYEATAPEQLDEWFRRQGLGDVVVPRQFNYELLHERRVVEFQGREVAELWFVKDNHSAHVYILSGKQFDLDHLEQQGQRMAQGNRTVKVLRNPDNPQIVYLVVYSGELELFFSKSPQVA